MPYTASRSVCGHGRSFWGSSKAWSWVSLVAKVYSPSSKLPFNARPTTESTSTRKPRHAYRTFTPLHKIWCSAPLEWLKSCLLTPYMPVVVMQPSLELAGAIAHAGALSHHQDIWECTVATFSDNTPAVVWGTKASVTTMGPTAYLLHTASLHQWHHRYLLQCAYIPVPASVLADIASRCFDLSDDALLRRLTTLSPHAQKWQMLTTSPELVLQLICNLLRKRPNKPYLRNAPAPLISFGPNTGCHTQNRCTWTPSYPLWRTKYPTSASSRTAFDLALPAAVVSQSGLHAYVTKSSPLQRASPTWVNPTCASRLLDSWTPGSRGCIQPTPTKIRPHIMLNPSQSKSSTTPRL